MFKLYFFIWLSSGAVMFWLCHDDNITLWTVIGSLCYAVPIGAACSVPKTSDPRWIVRTAVGLSILHCIGYGHVFHIMLAAQLILCVLMYLNEMKVQRTPTPQSPSAKP